MPNNRFNALQKNTGKLWGHRAGPKGRCREKTSLLQFLEDKKPIITDYLNDWMHNKKPRQYRLIWPVAYTGQMNYEYMGDQFSFHTDNVNNNENDNDNGNYNYNDNGNDIDNANDKKHRQW